MPQLFNISVHVTDVQGQPLQEWAVQPFPRQKKASAYIESVENLEFQVTVQAPIPYIDPRDPSASSGPPPYHFLASLYLNGQQKAERIAGVILDPGHQYYNLGRISMKDRLVRAADGSLRKYPWVFNDIGIHRFMDRMAISEDHATTDSNDERTVAMNIAALDLENDVEKEEKKGLGQIEVIIERVVVQEGLKIDDYHPRHSEGEPEDDSMSEPPLDLSHIASIAEKGIICPNDRISLKPMHYDKEHERPFAAFKFFYRDQDTLRKFIPNFQPRSRPYEAAAQHQALAFGPRPTGLPNTSSHLNPRHRAGQSSGAADAWDEDGSDQEPDPGEDDQDATVTDLVPSQDKDDEGLHHGIGRLKLNPPKPERTQPVRLRLTGPRKRQCDDDGEGKSDSSDGAGSGSGGPTTQTAETGGKQACNTEGQNKRFKRQD